MQGFVLSDVDPESKPGVRDVQARSSRGLRADDHISKTRMPRNDLPEQR